MKSPRATLTEPDVRQRSQRFASLRAAQRILTHSAHPTELEATFAQGRDVLQALQRLSARVTQANAEPTADDREALRRVDELLDAISARTRALLDRTPFSELRAQLPRVVREHPDEVRGLVDTVLEGNVESDKNLRILEYLVTLLSSEGEDSRRTVTREPAELAPRLAAFARDHLAGEDDEFAVAAKVITQATGKLLRGEDAGPIRDRIRAYKEELGSRILHPRVISAVVEYNVAMWNRVAGMIEGSRLLDRLADDLLTAEPGRVAATTPTAGATAVRDSAAFVGLTTALRARLSGASDGADAAALVVARFEIGGLTPSELEAFEADDADAWIIRAAVTLNLARRCPDVAPDLRELGIDPQSLETTWRNELMGEITAVAQKLLADGQFSAACRLSEIRAKNLGIPTRAGESSPIRVPLVRHEPRRASTLEAAGLGKFVAAAGVLLWFVLMGSFLSTTDGADSISKGELADLSPYLESGYRSQEGGATRFVGTLNTSWDRVATAERRDAAESIGQTFERIGVQSVVLLDRFQRLQVSYAHGGVVELAPHPADSGTHATSD